MSQSVIILLDPQPEVLRAIQENLQQSYHQKVETLYANSLLETLKKLKDLRLRCDRQTLVIVEQKLPLLEDAELWQLAIDMFPKVQRLILKVYDSDDIPSCVPIPNAFVICKSELEAVLPEAQLLTSKS